ncbi:MAG: hypothetical protein ABIQ41_08065 [Gemmatimonadales bacterium]
MNMNKKPAMPELEDGPIEPEEGGVPVPEDGYMICIKFRPGRITVCMKPLDPEPAPGAEMSSQPEYEEIEVDNIEQALKVQLKMHKDRPLDESEDAHLAAGYGEHPAV